MSIHPSLKIDAAGTAQRSVLSRIERIKDLMKKGLWKEEHAVTGLPKTKIVRVKAKKAAKEAAPGAEGAAPEAAASGGAKKPEAATGAAAAKKPEAAAAKKPEAAKDKK